MVLSAFGIKPMNVLEKNKGETVWTEFIYSGKWHLVVGTLEDISMFKYIEIKNIESILSVDINNLPMKYGGESSLKIPFLWERIGIQKINLEKEGKKELVFENFLLPDDYNVSDISVVLNLIELIFGEEVARMIFSESLKQDKMYTENQKIGVRGLN
ncbi:MAG: hypothetical protein P1P85_02770 [Patescibacteria group bacterium]|nr:hypothetical protein [Patescibacteria group bacterium]